MLHRLLPWLLAAAAAGQAAASAAAITLTQVPAGMIKQNAPIVLGWTGGQGRVHLRASTVPGSGASISHYDSLHLPDQMESGSYGFRINPDIPELYRNTDLRFGVNYCILSDGKQSSPEFIILVESSNAPVLVSPANAASLKELTPTFSWTGDAPFFAVLVSDEPFKISDSGTVTGVSAVWQIITPFKSARYGDADPSGINGLAAPPLISGKTYNWLVLNNYGNNSASTSKVAPVPASFVFSPGPPLPQPQLIEPLDRDTVPGLGEITFRWSLVEGAVSYKVELLEENLVDGSQADLVVWKASSTGGQIKLENAAGILRRYQYKWRVYAIGSTGSASLSAKRSFFYAVDVGNITITVSDDKARRLPYVPVKFNRIGGASSAVFQSGSTDNTGVLTVSNAPLGNYESRIENVDGFQARVDTVAHNRTSGSALAATLKPVTGKIIGKVASGATGVLNARVTVSGSDGSQWTALTNSQGSYTLGVPYGNWQVKAQADGYTASGSASVTLNSTAPSQTVDLALTAFKYTLSGTVLNSFSRQGVYGASVLLSETGGNRTATTDGNGSFAFAVPGGPVTLRISNPGFAAPEPQTVNVEGDKSLVISIDPNASILAGRTRDASGTALTGVTVEAVPRAGPSRSVLSDAQGSFEASLPAGDWILNASAKGYTAGNTHKFLLDVSKTIQGVDFALTANKSFIAGRVTENAVGLSGAKVFAGEAATLSDNAGYYLLSVAAGTHTVQASKEGYLVARTYTVPVNAGDTAANIHFNAVGNAGVVRGKVLSGGTGVAEARVQAVNQGNRETFVRTTDGQGDFAFSLPGGSYTLGASKEGFAPESTALAVQSGGTLLDANLKLALNQGTLLGTVASGNTFLGGCEVAYRNLDQSALAGKTVTDPQGRYSFSLQAGSGYALSAVCAGYQAVSAQSASLPRGQTVTQDFNLPKAGSILKGKAVDGAGAPLAAVKVTAERNGELVSGFTDLAGAFTLSLGSGTYALSLSKVGFRTRNRQAQLSLGENPSAPDTLAATLGKVAGRISADGSGLAGALVTWVGLSPEAGGASFLTDADGRFAGENLPAGNYGLSANAEGFADGKVASLTVVAGQLTNVDLALQPNRASLAGLVKVGGAAGAGVKVAATAYGVSRSVLSGADGRYLLDKLPAGVYAVSAALAGHGADRAWENQSLGSSGSLSGLDFNLTANAGSLSGTVTGISGGSGIRIILVGKQGFRAYGDCDAAGKYSLPSLPADTYTLSVAATGYKLSVANPDIAITGATTYHPALVPALFRLVGKLLNQSGSGVAGLPMELRFASERLKTLSGADGSYDFPEVPSGQEYQLSCRPPNADFDARDTTFSQALDAPSQVTVNLQTLSRQSSVSGSVFLDSLPVEGASLRLTGSRNNLAGLSQPGGAFKLSGLAGSDAAVSLTVSRAGANTLDTSFTVKIAEAKTGLALRLKTLKIGVTATLTSSEGKPLAGARIISVTGNRRDTLTASAQGKITVAGLPANQNLTLATSLDKSQYDNVEASVLLKEKDTSLALQAPVHAATVAVQVRDQDGAAVDGAEVSMNGLALGTASGGSFTVRNLARGTYRFQAGKASYKGSGETALTLSGDTAAAMALAITRLQGGLYGTVSDSGTEPGVTALRKLAGVEVVLASTVDTLRDTSNSLGQYVVNGLADGRSYAVTLALPGYAPYSDTVTGRPQTQSKNPLLKPLAGTALGRVETGKAGVGVRLFHAASGRIRFAATALGGYYAFTGLQHRQDYAVQAVDGNSSSPFAAFLADGGQPRRLDLAMDVRAGASGVITGGSPARPLEGAEISLRSALTGAAAWTLSDSAGRYAVTGLAGGEVEASVLRPGYRAPSSRKLVLAKGLASAADFFLEAAESGISGTAKDAEGRGLPAMITLIGDRDTVSQAADARGQFLFAGLPQGAYRLEAALAGYSAPVPATLAYSGSGLHIRDMALARRQNRILGTARDALTNVPLAGASLRVLQPSVSAVADSQGRFELALPAGSSGPLYLEASQSGYLTRNVPVYLDGDGSALAEITLAADYRFDGELLVSVREGAALVPGLFFTVQSLHPEDSLRFSVTGPVPNSFPNLRRPVAYSLRVKRDGFRDLVKVVDLTAAAASKAVVLNYPTSQIRIFATSDGRKGRGAELTLDGQRLSENPDTVGLYASAAKLKPGRYEAAIRNLDSNLILPASHFIDLGEDSLRTDTLAMPFFQVPIADSTIGSAFTVRVRRVDSLRPAPGVACSLFFRLPGDPAWSKIKLDSAAGGFAGNFPARAGAGIYQYYFSLRSPAGVRAGVVTSAGATTASLPLLYANSQSPSQFNLRDPFLLQSLALFPQRLEADTSLYSLGGRDLFQVLLRGEKGRSLDAHFDGQARDTAFSVAWDFSNPAAARAAGLSLEPDSSTPRMIRFRAGNSAGDSLFQVVCTVRMGSVRLRKSFNLRIQDLAPVSIGVKYLKENRVLAAEGAALTLGNENPEGYAFSAFATTAEGRVFNVSPRWSLGSDSSAGTLTQQGVFIPNPAVARSAVLEISDSLVVGFQGGTPLRKAFSFRAELATLAQVVPSATGSARVTDGEGTVLDFNLAGLNKAFTVSVKKPRVSGLLRSSPRQEVVGDILDIELSEKQPFKADSGAVLKMPVTRGVARQRMVYLSHWNSGLLAWEKVDSVRADSAVNGKVYSFSKYAVIMGSLPLGAYDLVAAPNPFSALDPWGLQLGYKVSSDVSSLVGVRVEVYNMMGDKIYESLEQQLSKGDAVLPGTHQANPQSAERRGVLGPFVWDGRDSKGVPCRNGRYLLKLIVKDGTGRKEYLKKVVMLK